MRSTGLDHFTTRYSAELRHSQSVEARKLQQPRASGQELQVRSLSLRPFGETSGAQQCAPFSSSRHLREMAGNLAAGRDPAAALHYLDEPGHRILEHDADLGGQNAAEISPLTGINSMEGRIRDVQRKSGNCRRNRTVQITCSRPVPQRPRSAPAFPAATGSKG